MLKKLLCIVFSLLIILSLTACNNKNKNGDNINTPNETDYADINDIPEDASSPDITTTGNTNKITVDNTPVIAKGETQTAEKYEFFVDYFEITDNVVPPQPASYYRHYEAEEGKEYVDLCIAYKNTAASAISADNILNGSLIYGGKYVYDCFTTIEEDNRGSFTYSNITNIDPLCTEYIHAIFTIPDEVAEATESLVVKLKVIGDNYKVIIREGNDSSIDSKKNNQNKKSGEVALNETIVTKNSEFFIEYTDITDDVAPPQPASYYRHYEADSGKTYVDVCFSYKNTSTKNKVADNLISAKLKYANKYDYKGFSIIEEESRGDFTYSNITSVDPLTTEYIHYLFEVPNEVAESTESILVNFTIDGNSYSYKVR